MADLLLSVSSECSCVFHAWSVPIELNEGNVFTWFHIVQHSPSLNVVTKASTHVLVLSVTNLFSNQDSHWRHLYILAFYEVFWLILTSHEEEIVHAIFHVNLNEIKSTFLVLDLSSLILCIFRSVVSNNYIKVDEEVSLLHVEDAIFLSLDT